MTQEEFRNELARLDELGLEVLEKKPIIIRLVREYLQDQETITRQFFEEFGFYIGCIKKYHLYTYRDYLIEQRDKEISEKCVKVDIPKERVYRDRRSSENILPLRYHRDTEDIFKLLSMEDTDRYELFKWIFWNHWVKLVEEEWGYDYYLISSLYIDRAKKYVPQFLERLMGEDKELFERYEAEKEKEEAITGKYDKILTKLSMEERDRIIGIRIDYKLIRIID